MRLEHPVLIAHRSPMRTQLKIPYREAHASRRSGVIVIVNNKRIVSDRATMPTSWAISRARVYVRVHVNLNKSHMFPHARVTQPVRLCVRASGPI